MKVLVLCISFFVGTTLGMGANFMGAEDGNMGEKWARFKAMESCYGEDIMKTYMLKMKRAIAKCTKAEMPELDLPMFR